MIEADGATLTFRHALTREAVYDALLPGERRRLHAAVAAALYERPDMTDAAELAVQWRAAGEPAAALAASIEAARAAAGVYAYSEAVEHYTAAVALWSSADATDLDRAEILLDAADAAYRAGADDLPIEWCELGLAALGEDPDPRRAADVLRAARPLPGPSPGQVAVVLQRGAAVPRRCPERRARPPARRREPHAHAERALG